MSEPQWCILMNTVRLFQIKCVVFKYATSCEYCVSEPLPHAVLFHQLRKRYLLKPVTDPLMLI